MCSVDRPTVTHRRCGLRPASRGREGTAVHNVAGYHWRRAHTHARTRQGALLPPPAAPTAPTHRPERACRSGRRAGERGEWRAAVQRRQGQHQGRRRQAGGGVPARPAAFESCRSAAGGPQECPSCPPRPPEQRSQAAGEAHCTAAPLCEPCIAMVSHPSCCWRYRQAPRRPPYLRAVGTSEQAACSASRASKGSAAGDQLDAGPRRKP